jgi:hypothetical protein
MINFLSEMYTFFMTFVSISFLVAALFVWYCVHRDMKERKIFDEKYRKSRKDKL